MLQNVTTKGKNNAPFIMVDQYDDNSIEAFRYTDAETFGETQYTTGRWQPKGFKAQSNEPA